MLLLHNSVTHGGSTKTFSFLLLFVVLHFEVGKPFCNINIIKCNFDSCIRVFLSFFKEKILSLICKAYSAFVITIIIIIIIIIIITSETGNNNK